MMGVIFAITGGARIICDGVIKGFKVLKYR